MKKQLIILMYCLLSIQLCFAQTWDWAVQTTGNGWAISIGIVVDPLGNSYVTGTFLQTSIFGTCGSYTASGYQDIFVAKYDNSGSCVWVKQAGGNFSAGSDGGGDITLDKTGDLLVTGSFKETAYFDAISVAPSPSGNFNLFVAKYDNNGNAIWATGCEGNGNGIATDTLGNIYVTGTGVGTWGGCTLTGGMVVAKLDVSGNCIWTKSVNNATGNKIKVDAIGNIYVTGYFIDTAYFDTDTAVSFGLGDAFIAKYDGNGNEIWVNFFGSNGSDGGGGIGMDTLGNIYISGGSGFPLYSSCDTLMDNGFTAKFDSFGNCIWIKPLGGTIFTDAQGNSYIVTNAINSGSCLFSAPNVYVVKLDPNGNCTYLAQGILPTSTLGINAIDCNNNTCYLAGSNSGTVTFGSSVLTTNAGDIGAVIAKLSSVTSVLPQNNRVSNFNLYPNPSSGSYTMEVSTDFLNAQMYIYNTLGSLLFEQQINKKLTTINIPSLKQGIYQVVLVKADGTSVHSSMVQQ